MRPLGGARRKFRPSRRHRSSCDGVEPSYENQEPARGGASECDGAPPGGRGRSIGAPGPAEHPRGLVGLARLVRLCPASRLSARRGPCRPALALIGTLIGWEGSKAAPRRVAAPPPLESRRLPAASWAADSSACPVGPCAPRRLPLHSIHCGCDPHHPACRHARSSAGRCPPCRLMPPAVRPSSRRRRLPCCPPSMCSRRLCAR